MLPIKENAFAPFCSERKSQECLINMFSEESIQSSRLDVFFSSIGVQLSFSLQGNILHLFLTDEHVSPWVLFLFSWIAHQ